MIATTIKLSGLPTTTKAERAALFSRSWEQVGGEWRQRHLKSHFTQAGARKYGYAPRKKSYTRRKLREQKHRRPLEFHGEGRQQAGAPQGTRAKRRHMLKFSQRQVTVKLPRKFNWKHPRSKVRMAVEIREVTRPELTGIARYFRDEVEQRLKKIGKHRKITFRTGR